jgi:predicted RNA methylase
MSVLRWRKKLINLIWELRLGISTRGVENVAASTTERGHYGTIPYITIHNVLNSLALTPTDEFVDLGCGKGRVICCVSRLAVAEVIGVEYMSKLCDDARRNIKTMKGKCSPVTVVNMPAEEFDYTKGTVYYLFHPFGPQTLQKVVDGIKNSFLKRKRTVRIAYVNSVYDSVLKNCSWLHEYDRWEGRDRRSLEHAISFWRSTD